MVKIGFVMEELWVGGGPRNVYTLSELLRKDGIESFVISLTDQSKLFGIETKLPRENKRALIPLEPFSSLNLISIGMASKVSSLFLPLQFVLGSSSLFSVERFDAYIATAWTTLYPVISVSKIKKAVPLYFIQAYETEFSVRKLRRILANRTYTYPVVKFTHSRWVKKLLDLFFPSTSYYIGMGINHKVFYPKESIPFKHQVLTIARCGRDKGFDIFVKSINYLRKIRQDFNVVIIGERKALESEMMNFPYVFKGWISSDLQLADLYRESVFVNTGRWEALPMPPLEAMACGSAVVMTNMQGAREYAKDHYNCIL
ncbi:MAG: glycosyltransferase family 4 protein, partial [Thermoproteota archaeon]